MKQVFSRLLWAVAGIMFVAAPASAHFGMVIVSDNMIMQDDPRTIFLIPWKESAWKWPARNCSGWRPTAPGKI